MLLKFVFCRALNIVILLLHRKDSSIKKNRINVAFIMQQKGRELQKNLKENLSCFFSSQIVLLMLRVTDSNLFDQGYFIRRLREKSVKTVSGPVYPMP